MSDKLSMKILICNFESLRTPSGVTSYAVKLLRHLPCLRALTTRNTFQTPLEGRETNLAAKTRYNEIIWMTYANIRRMNREIRKADLIHLNPFNFTELVLLFLTKIHGKRCIATMHSNINAYFLTPVLALEMARLIIVYNIMLLTADKLIFLSQAHAENFHQYSLLKKRFPAKATIIPNAMEDERILPVRKPLPGTPLNCLFVGRLERRKGIYDVLKLAELLREEGDDGIHFTIAGFGPLTIEKTPPNVTFVGKIPNEDIFAYYDRSHVLLMASYSEACGINILEAMARGLVVLASDIPGIRERIEPDRNGYLFQPGDIGTMKEQLLHLRNNPQEMERIGQNNLADVRQFTVANQAKQYLAVYRNVLNHAPSKSF